MKLKLFFLFSLALFARAQMDYTDLTGSTWNDLCFTEQSGRIISPIDMTGSTCTAYTTFEISLPATASIADMDQAYGAPTADLTGGSLTVNSDTYTASKILLRTKSEHIVHSGRGDLELQILLTGSKNAILSFIIRSTEGISGLNKVEEENPIITTDGATSVEVNLDTINNIFKNKIDNDLFLNLLTYEGIATYTPCAQVTWYVYGSDLYIKDTELTKFTDFLDAKNVAPNNAILRNGENSRTLSSGDPVLVQRLCYTGYFETYMNENYGLWFGVTIVMLWFIINLILGEKPIKDDNYRENTWTHHPFVSLKTVGNDIFSRKQRMSLLLVTITVHALFSSAWWRKSENKTRSSNIIVFAIYSMLVNWVVTYIVGLMLRGYCIAKHQYYKTKNENFDQKAQNRLFAFYFSLFFIVVVGWPFTVWNMGELHPEIDAKPSDYWVATFFVGLGLEFLLIDPIVCILAKKIGFVHKFIKGKGYFYDNLCHEAYLNYLKWD